MENMKLNNNLECPMLGLGTFMLSPEDAYTSTLEALKMGYSLIDTANAYVNERAVGRAIKDSGIERKNIFLSTKIWASEYENENAVEETLERLGVDYVDLLYIHQPAGNWLAGYRMLEKRIERAKQNPLVSRILKENIWKSWKQSGKLYLSLFRWKHIHISHRKNFV